MAADEVRRFGLTPKVAFLSHSMYGSSKRASALKMRAARDRFVRLAPDVEADGELQGDAALSDEVRQRFLPDATLSGAANVLILPNLDAANILFNVLKMTGGKGVTVGPILLGAAAPVHILTPSETSTWSLRQRRARSPQRSQRPILAECPKRRQRSRPSHDSCGR